MIKADYQLLLSIYSGNIVIVILLIMVKYFFL